MNFHNSWFIGKRFRIPIWWNWGMNIPQPRQLKRWYYRKSYKWWNHPSNHHWKGWIHGIHGDGYTEPNNFIKWINKKCSLHPGERDLWGGGYYPDDNNSDEK